MPLGSLVSKFKPVAAALPGQPKPLGTAPASGVVKPFVTGMSASTAAAGTKQVNMPGSVAPTGGTPETMHLSNKAAGTKPTNVPGTPGYAMGGSPGAMQQSRSINGISASAVAAANTNVNMPVSAGTQQSNPTTNPAPTSTTGFQAPQSTALGYDAALAQANQQLDPEYQRAVADSIAQEQPGREDAGQIASAHGGAHSGLGADLVNKVHIAASDKRADLAAQRASQAATIAQQLVQQSQARADQQRAEAFNEYLGQGQLGISKDQVAIQGGQLTGYYESPEMQNQYDIVNQAKQDWANATTPEEKAAAHQRADDARSALTQMNANAGLVGSDVTLGQAQANQGKYGVKTLDQQRMEYDQSAANPANQAQIISNKISQINLDNLPAQTKLGLKQLQQEVDSGAIDLKTAQYNLNELTDPKSVTNQRNDLQLQLDKLNVSNTSTQNALEVQKLKAQIADIGKTPPTSDYEKQMNQVKLDTAKEKLKQLQASNGSQDQTKQPDLYKAIDQLNTAYLSRNPSTGVTSVTNPDALRRAILAKNLSDDATDQLLTYYGLPTG